MPAQKPERPQPGSALVLPRVDDEQTQRALDRITTSSQQTQAQIDALSATAAAIPTLGRLLRTPRILSGTSSSTLTPGTCVVRLRGIGQGGGGGGAVGGACGAGGTSGVLLDIWIGTPGTPLASTAISWTAGSGAGGGGTAAGTNGAAGSDSTITINGVAYTMKGGGGGGGQTVGGTFNTAVTTVPAAGTTAGGITTYGLGGSAFADPGVTGYSGAGGGTDTGAGGVGVVAGAGRPGDSSGFGGGGSGGNGANAGGAGAAGGFIIEEYS